MQVGDLVKSYQFIDGGIYGIITEICSASAQIRCLWSDGALSWCLKWHVEVICK